MSFPNERTDDFISGTCTDILRGSGPSQENGHRLECQMNVDTVEERREFGARLLCEREMETLEWIRISDCI